MKKKIVPLLILALSVGFASCGTDKEPIKANKEEIPQEFKLISNNRIDSELPGTGTVDLMVVQHKETGKRFIIYHDYRRGGICPLD